MDDELNVWFEDHLVGYLSRNGFNIMAFRYSEEWLASDKTLGQLACVKHQPAKEP